MNSSHEFSNFNVQSALGAG